MLYLLKTTVKHRNMKKISSTLKAFALTMILSLGCFMQGRSQDNVGVGTTTPDASAIMELLSANKGLLVPRMNTAGMLAIPTPANSLLIYNTDSMCYFFYRLPSTTWVSLCSGGSGSGSAGPAGPTGPTGAAGLAGATGATGANGIDGINGIDGATGPTGAAGIAGATGATGATGANGVDGVNGTNGTNGLDGATGATGSAGVAGATGATGAAGTNGATGATGATGAAGTNGATGATGVAGAAGTPGAAGATGATGATGIIQTYHVYGTAGRIAVASATPTVQPGLTQTFTTTTTTRVIVWATIGGRTTGTGSANYANVDMIIYLDGAFLPVGGWNRFQVTNPSTTNSFNTCAINTSFTLAPGTHTIDLRTLRLAGSTSTVDIGGNAATDVNPGELTIMILN
jgi:hypothetical protein